MGALSFLFLVMLIGAGMRLLHIAPNYLPAWRYGGPIRSVHGLCRALVELGHEVHVYTTDVDGASRLEVPLGAPVDRDGVKVWYFPVSFPRRIFHSPAMRKMLAEKIGEFDFVHLHSTYLWPMWAAARAARKVGVPYVLTPRGTLVKELVQSRSRYVKTAWIHLIETITIRDASFLHVTSEHEAVELRHFNFRLPPVEVIPNGIDLAGELDEHATRAGGDKESRILFLGRLSWEKGLDRLIPAMACLPEARLLIAGNDEKGYRVTLEALAARHGVSARVQFLGPVHGAEKERLFNSANLVVLPSYSENFGNVVLEAWARGCPVAVTPEVGLASVVKETGAGAVVPGEPQSMGTALKSLLARPAALEMMAVRGRQVVVDQFNWAAIARRMEAAYVAHGLKGKRAAA